MLILKRDIPCELDPDNEKYLKNKDGDWLLPFGLDPIYVFNMYGRGSFNHL